MSIGRLTRTFYFPDSFHWSLLAVASRLCCRFRACVEDRVWVQRSSAVLGLDSGSVVLFAVYCCRSSVILIFYLTDASPDFPNSKFFDPSPEHGFGGWGDPDNDYEISTGAFAKGFERAYPVPHNLRRNYTAQGSDPDPFGDGTPGATLPFWNYFTQDRVDLLVNGFVGDFNAFHAQFEGTTVSRTSGRDGHLIESPDAIDSYVLGCSWSDPRVCRRVSAF